MKRAFAIVLFFALVVWVAGHRARPVRVRHFYYQTSPQPDALDKQWRVRNKQATGQKPTGRTYDEMPGHYLAEQS